VFTSTGYQARRVGMKNAVYDIQFPVFKTCCAIFTNGNSRFIGFDFIETNEANQSCNGRISLLSNHASNMRPSAVHTGKQCERIWKGKPVIGNKLTRPAGMHSFINHRISTEDRMTVQLQLIDIQTTSNDW
jgi:hypothetical protein